MKRTLTATAAILAVLAMPAYAQVSGIDTTTTPSTDASIDIDPPGMETGADIMADGQPYPDDVLDLESRNEVDADLPPLTDEQRADAETAVSVDDEVEAQGDADLDAENLDAGTPAPNEFEPEPDIDIGSQLDLKIEDQ